MLQPLIHLHFLQTLDVLMQIENKELVRHAGWCWVENALAKDDAQE
jgi:hypothetical protein